MANALDRPPPPRQPAIATTPRGEVAEIHEESTTSILRSALEDVGDIVRAEMNLALVEIREDAKKLARTAPMGAAGAALALVGGVFLLHTLALALDVVLPGWAAYLIVTTVALAIGGALIAVAAKRLRNWKSFVPERTIETLEENKRWIQRKLS